MSTSKRADPFLTPNVASRLFGVAAANPAGIAIATPIGKFRPGMTRDYDTISFADLEFESSSIAAGLQKMGVQPGMRIALLVRYGPEFISLVFALLKVGAVIILIDPGMGKQNLIQCLQATNPDGFVAIPAAQAIRAALRHKFPKARFNVTVGNTFGLLPKPTMEQLAGTPSSTYVPPVITDDSEAAIIFTTGSTGPPKGVLYTHRTFNRQIDQLTAHYGITPGGKDLSGFPLFGLFNAVMGTTTIIPDMNPTRPADADPVRILDAIDQWKINQAFGSPALWTTIGRYTSRIGRKAPSLFRALSAGAPVPTYVLEWTRAMMAPEGNFYTPYGATEALPVASIESREILGETAQLTKAGAGTCVGHRFSGIDWKVIAIEDQPLERIDQIREVSPGQIGELMVRGDVVTRQYVTRTEQNSLHKVQDGDTFWHRMGDVGYLDNQDRFWCCGRKSHRVRTALSVLFTEPCEAIFNTHPHVHRSALVGIGEPGNETPVLIAEPWPEFVPPDSLAEDQLASQLRAIGHGNEKTEAIERILIYPRRLPTDIRHNSKIFREKLRPWAEQQLSKRERR